MSKGEVKLKRHSVTFILAVIWVILLVTCVFFADFIANQNPIAIKLPDEGWVLTIFGVPPGIDPSQYEAVYAPVRYSPEQLDFEAARFHPFFLAAEGRYDPGHPLGTDELGRDIFSGLIHGTRTSIFVAFFAMLFATFNGVLIGGVAGFIGDRGLRLSRRLIMAVLAALSLSWYYAWYIRQYILEQAWEQGALQGIGATLLSLFFVLLAAGVAFLLHRILAKSRWATKAVIVPVDMIVQRVVEVFTSIPQLFLILTIITIASPSLFLFAMIIGFTFWTNIARLVRSEMIRIREYTYVEAARAIGLSNFWVFVKHALPNVYKMIAIYFAFGLASTIIMESTLSFIGAGIPPDTVSWGKMLSKFSMLDWWKSVIPGAAIIVTVLAFHRLGESVNHRNRLRHL